jgi:drug/metabolite transporter (DMT)-like permease
LQADLLLGGLAGLGAALSWAMSTVIWGLVAHRVPPQTLIVIRATLSSLALSAGNYALHGRFWPAGAAGESLFLLALSGWLAINLGDFCFFKAVQRIGPRLLMVIFAAAPIVTAAIAWVTMHEALTPRTAAGIVLTVGGIVLVVSEPRGETRWTRDPREFRLGVALTVASLVAVGISYVFSRAAVHGGARLFTQGDALAPMDGLDAALVRLAAAGLLGWVSLPLTGTLRPTFTTLASPALMRYVLPATFLGLVVGSWLSMLALGRLPSGVASALLSCSPIFMLPLSRLVFGERHSARSLAGTVVAVGGVFLLLL